MLLVPRWEAVFLHLIWVSAALLYGFRLWRGGPTIAVLVVATAATGVCILADYLRGAQPQVPLPAAMFAVMAWHAHRRLAATEQIERVSEYHRRLVDRQRAFIQDASHVLRTPITIALGHAELIQRSAASAYGKDATVVVE